ncbi:hypothetical protein GGI21_006786, partial [Coemansia aciculifera]
MAFLRNEELGLRVRELERIVDNPQVQLAVVMAFVVLLLGVPNTVTPSATMRLVETQPLIRIYSASWRSQLVIGISGILGILATNVAGPRWLMVLGSTCGTLFSTSLIISQYHQGGGGWYVAAAVVEDVGHTMMTVALVTVLLTYPREQRKARTLALFQFLVNLSLTLGQVVEVGGKTAAWIRLAGCVAALVGVAPWMVPVSRVVRDTGVYVVVEGHGELKRELRGLAMSLQGMALV